MELSPCACTPECGRVGPANCTVVRAGLQTGDNVNDNFDAHLNDHLDIPGQRPCRAAVPKVFDEYTHCNCHDNVDDRSTEALDNRSTYACHVLDVDSCGIDFSSAREYRWSDGYRAPDCDWSDGNLDVLSRINRSCGSLGSLNGAGDRFYEHADAAAGIAPCVLFFFALIFLPGFATTWLALQVCELATWKGDSSDDCATPEAQRKSRGCMTKDCRYSEYCTRTADADRNETKSSKWRLSEPTGHVCRCRIFSPFAAVCSAGWLPPLDAETLSLDTAALTGEPKWRRAHSGTSLLSSCPRESSGLPAVVCIAAAPGMDAFRSPGPC